MRGASEQQIESMIALTPEDLVPRDHPIRRIKPLADRALQELSPTFNRMYAKVGRPSVPPEHLLKASLLIALYSVRSERQFCDRLAYDMLFRWFLDLNVRGGSFDQSTFAKNRARLLEHEVTGQFFQALVSEARRQHLLSEDHFSVDGTLLEAWASIKSVRPKDEDAPPPAAESGRNPWKDFKGERRSNATHASTTDPEALLARKGNGQPAKLSFAGHVLMENRNGLVVDLVLSQATGTAETEAALTMLERVPTARHITVGADKGYDTKDFVITCRSLAITPHVASKRRYSAVDGRTTRRTGYEVSQRVRKRIEEVFGWLKTVGGGRKLRYRGVDRNRSWAAMALAAYNLVRMAKLTPPTPVPGAASAL
jgi:transposase